MVADEVVDWLLVVAIAIGFVVIPVVILLRPPALPFRVSFIVLPLIPGVLLALIGVWYALRRSRSEAT